jgi:hypothetical protein
MIGVQDDKSLQKIIFRNIPEWKAKIPALQIDRNVREFLIHELTRIEQEITFQIKLETEEVVFKTQYYQQLNEFLFQNVIQLCSLIETIIGMIENEE